MPPFTNHTDAPEYDEAGHGNHKHPDYKEATGYVPSLEEDEDDKEEETPEPEPEPDG